MKRIKHNDLLPWFTQDHNTLPASYIKKCKEFFGEVARSFLIARSYKRQATSVKQQAASGKEKMLEIFIIFTSLFILNMLGVFTIII
jgi:hypothetical protein